LRHEKEKELFKKSKQIPQPSYEELRAEKREEKPHLIFTIYDDAGVAVRKIIKTASKGINRVVWDLRYSSPSPVKLKKNKFSPTKKTTSGMLAMPGIYSVSMAIYHDGNIKQIGGPVKFTAKVLKNSSLPESDREKLVAFQKKSMKLARIIIGSEKYAEEMLKNVQLIKQTLYNTPTAAPELITKAENVEKALNDVLFSLNGQPSRASAEEVPPSNVSLNSRLGTLIWTHWRSTSGVTGNQRTAYKILTDEFPPVYNKLKNIGEIQIKQLQDDMEKLNSTWTPNRLPELNLK